MKPEDILREFWPDLEKATYWMNRQAGGEKGRVRRFQDMVYGIYCGAMKKRSEITYYDSPSTGNHWMMWDAVEMGHDGLKPPQVYRVCYRMLERYMCIMIPTRLASENDTILSGVTIYTPHVFQRMHERLGVDMTDRVTVIRNFCENLVDVMMDRREPRHDEPHDQIVCRLPGSWLRGHYIQVKNEYVIIYRTYYTDKTLTPYQWRELKSFRKIADKTKDTADFERYVREKKYISSKNER